MRQHDIEHSRANDPTRPTRRQHLAADAAKTPNFVLRRVVVAAVAVALVGTVVVAVATLTGTDGVAVEAPAAPIAVERPAVTAGETVPIHHGFHDDVLYVALYGSIGTGRLGILGENDVQGSIVEAATVAADYEDFGRTVVPTFEIIASVASFEAGADGDYSNETPIAQLRPWIDAADDAGYHVVLDLQSGRQRFDSQLVEFEDRKSTRLNSSHPV